ncbi:MAG: hypothetical protein ACRDT2_00660 [Natronosporangium sp.]
MVTVTGGVPGFQRSVGYRPWEANPERATCTWSTGPDLLAEAAMVLPEVVGRGPVRWVDIHATIYRAACTRGMGRDRPHRLRLADEALDMFTESLVLAGLAEPRKHPVRGWLAGTSMLDVQLALASAAGHYRLELATALAVSPGSAGGAHVRTRSASRWPVRSSPS